MLCFLLKIQNLPAIHFCKVLNWINCLSIFSAMIETKEVPRIVSLKMAMLGDKVTLHCGAEKESRYIHWYKQSGID